MIKIGITERGDAGTDFSWMKKHKNYDGIILITKCLSHRFIDSIVDLNLNCIVHATITGLGSTVYEPYIPSFDTSRILFEELIDRIGIERVVLRIDPIIPSDRGAAIAIHVYQQLYIDFLKKTRVRISFLDNYPHVKKRFKDAGLEPLYYYFHAPIELRKKIASYFPDAEICGEPGFDCTGCISEKDLKILGIEADVIIGGWQRKECKCLTYKIEMLDKKEQCQNRCLYCYWK